MIARRAWLARGLGPLRAQSLLQVPSFCSCRLICCLFLQLKVLERIRQAKSMVPPQPPALQSPSPSHASKGTSVAAFATATVASAALPDSIRKDFARARAAVFAGAEVMSRYCQRESGDQAYQAVASVAVNGFMLRSSTDRTSASSASASGQSGSGPDNDDEGAGWPMGPIMGTARGAQTELAQHQLGTGIDSFFLTRLPQDPASHSSLTVNVRHSGPGSSSGS
jgi:hypothetical protein